MFVVVRKTKNMTECVRVMKFTQAINVVSVRCVN